MMLSSYSVLLTHLKLKLTYRHIFPYAENCIVTSFSPIKIDYAEVRK